MAVARYTRTIDQSIDRPTTPLQKRKTKTKEEGMKDWTTALDWTGREPWGLDRTILVAQVFTDTRRRVVARDVRTVDVVVGMVDDVGTAQEDTSRQKNDPPHWWLQNSVRRAQILALRDKVIPYLTREETALYRRYQVVRAIHGGVDEEEDKFFFTSEEWSDAVFDPQQLLRCKPWHPHLLVWIWCEIVGGDDGQEEEELELAAAAVPEEKWDDGEDDREDVAEPKVEEASLSSVATVRTTTREQGRARTYRRCAQHHQYSVRVRRPPPPLVFSLTMRRRRPREEQM